MIALSVADTRSAMAVAQGEVVALCCHCGNDDYEAFLQYPLEEGGHHYINCLKCHEFVSPLLWQELLEAKLARESTQHQIAEYLKERADELLEEVKPEEVLPVCFELPCKCGSLEFRNIEDGDGDSTLAHVKVCDECYDIMGVDDNVLKEELLDLLSKATIRTTECTGCGNTDPNQYRFERGDKGIVIQCMVCHRNVQGRRDNDGQVARYELPNPPTGGFGKTKEKD